MVRENAAHFLFLPDRHVEFWCHQHSNWEGTALNNPINRILHEVISPIGLVLLAMAANCASHPNAATPEKCPVQPTEITQTDKASPSTQTPSQNQELSSDEGMWLLNNFPSERLGHRHGFAPNQEWLDEVRLSSVRLAGGCSGSFVSPKGLVMTNHHCAVRCIQHVSTKQKDFLKDGFYAKRSEDEQRCPEVEINQLVEIRDVTDRVNKATDGMDETRANEARKAVMSTIEKECSISESIRCDVVSLFHGGLYHLYRYRRYQDVRLVFAPEKAIASFGGDPDNFNFPRYSFDVAFLRVYDQGKPLASDHYFRWSESGAHDGELTFVSGHPARTSRSLTVAQLSYLRDYRIPWQLAWYGEIRGALREFQKRGPEFERAASTTLWGAENSIKAWRGRHQALVDNAVIAQKVKEEKDLRDRVNADPGLKSKCGDAWDKIEAAQNTRRAMRDEYEFVENGIGFWSTLMDYARIIVRAAGELPKPNDQRIRKYADSNLPSLRQQLYSTAPINQDLEEMKLTMSLTRMREFLGADHKAVKAALGDKSPAQIANKVIRGTTLGSVDARKRLFNGISVDGANADRANPPSMASEANNRDARGRDGGVICSLADPAIELACAIEPLARVIREAYEREVEAVETSQGELIASARFALFGTSVYPDATFSLRLSFGTVAGVVESNDAQRRSQSVTTIEGLFARNTGAPPFAMPATWIKAKDRLDMSTPMDLSTTNDIIGGNSGSPLFNKDRKIVGLVFDGNIHSLGGEYFYDANTNRAVSVHSAAVLEALRKVYGADVLRAEIVGE